MRKVLLAGAAVAALFSAGQAQADMAETGLAAGKCIVRADRSAAIDLMKRLPLGGETVALSELSLGAARKCWSEAPEPIGVMALRGGIAQELFRRDFVEYGVQPSESIANLATFTLPVEKDEMGAEDPLKSLYLIADCTARSDPQNTERLMSTKPGTDREMRVFEALGPLLSACQARANTVSVGRTELRAAITQAAYYMNARYWRGDMTYAGPSFRP